MVPGSRFRFRVLVRGSWFSRCWHRALRSAAPWPRRPKPRAQSRSPSPASSIAPGRTSTCARSSASGRGRRALPRIERTRAYIIEQLKAARRAGRSAGVRGEDTHRRDSDGEPHRHDSRAREGADRHHGPLRHQAVSRVPFRRRERRRVEHGVPASKSRAC